MYHFIHYVYGVLGCAVCPGGGGVNVEGKGKDGRVETTRLKNVGGIKYEGGLLSWFFCFPGICSLLSSFVVFGGMRYGNSNTTTFLFGV